MRANEEAVPDRTILFNHITPKMLDFKGIFQKINKPKRLKNFQFDTDFFCYCFNNNTYYCYSDNLFPLSHHLVLSPDSKYGYPSYDYIFN